MIKKKKILTQNQIEIKSFVYDWVIALSILFLVSIISLPPLIWNEENTKVFESRKRMLDLAYALKCYHTFYLD